MKKVISIISAVLIAGTAMFIPVFATVNTPDDAATYCFDNVSKISDWEFEGMTTDVGMKLEFNNITKEDGAGALSLTLKHTYQKLDQKWGGAYVTPDKVGLETFEGCSMQFSYRYGDKPEIMDSFTAYSNGEVSLDVPAPPNNPKSKNWETVRIEVPPNIKNDKLGFTIPSYEEYTGTAIYIDNVIIFDKDGNAIKNVGDFERASDFSYKTTPLWKMILIILGLVIALGVIGAGVFFAVKTMKQNKLR